MQSEPVTHIKQLEEMLKVEEREIWRGLPGVSQTKIESGAEVQKAEKIHQYSRKDSGLEIFWTVREEKKKTLTLCRLGV